MNEREKVIYLWFEMWIRQEDLGINDIFTEDVIYTESWGPQYKNRDTLKQWFSEWNTRGKVLVWDIRQFFHKGNQTIVEWYFKNQMKDGKCDEFEGMSLIVWSREGRISRLKEYGCNINNYDPYQNGDTPYFKNEKINWF